MSRWRDSARLALKSVRTPSQPAFRPSIESLALYAEPEAGALVPNTRLFRRPCDAPPAVTWAPPSAGAEKWEKWRKWPACQKHESDGPADCTVAFARRRRRRNDDDKGSISNTENETQLELLTIFFLTTFFLRKKSRENKEICLISRPGDGLSCCCFQSESNPKPMPGMETAWKDNSHSERGEHRERVGGRGEGSAMGRRTQSVRNAQWEGGGKQRAGKTRSRDVWAT